MAKPTVALNGVAYGWPKQPVVVVCIDGGDPAYVQRGLQDGIIPAFKTFIDTGFSAVADGTVPSFTCPNNMSIITGSPPSVHGISGNFYLNPQGEAVVMTGPELLRSETVLGEFSRRGAKVVSITAKDKLRKQLGKNMDMTSGSISFSSEKAGQCALAENGIENVLKFVGMEQPDMYSAELSLFVLEAGIRILETHAAKPDLMFLSLTDYIQHKYAPGEAEANRFYRAIDEKFARLHDLGAIVALTADHGMNDKSKPDGSPNVIWLQDLLNEEFGTGRTTVICPITDAFVAHHGALGGFVRVYCHDAKVKPDAIIKLVENLPGVASVYDKAGAARAFDLPLDREGDVVVIGDANTCIGASRADHDLSGLAGHRLRTHGAVAEASVPFIINRPLNDAYARRAKVGGLKSHHIFDFAINGAIPG